MSDPQPTLPGRYGQSVALSDDYILVGAPGDPRTYGSFFR